MNALKKFIKNTALYDIRADYLRGRREKKEMAAWQAAGKPVPPPQCYKQQVIREFRRSSGIRTFIETGTFYGDTLFACRKEFDVLFSIELDPALHQLAVKRFARNHRITVLQGDSGKVLEELLKTIHEPALFWLDGHYSEGVTAKGEFNTPILHELRSILSHHATGHVILVDDARCFTGDDDYPTLATLEDFVRSFERNLKFAVKDDLIRIYP